MHDQRRTVSLPASVTHERHADDEQHNDTDDENADDDGTRRADRLRAVAGVQRAVAAVTIRLYDFDTVVVTSAVRFVDVCVAVFACVVRSAVIWPRQVCNNGHITLLCSCFSGWHKDRSRRYK